MAKRKRLNPLLSSGEVQAPRALETKSNRGTPPITGIVQDAASTAALEEMSQVLRTAREGGRMVLELPLAQIQMDHLVRDRIASDPQELEALVTSLRSRGQQQPIEVVALGPERYGLISGWRRCQALAQLAAQQGRPAQVLALLRQPKDASDAYLAMVEENEIRVGLSYYERARIVLRAVEQGVYDSDKTALQTLFQGGSRAKRSKIGSFTHIVRALDGALRHPAMISERSGLALARRLEDEPEFAAALSAQLQRDAPATAEAERAILETAVARSAPAQTRGKMQQDPEDQRARARTPAASQEPVAHAEQAQSKPAQMKPRKIGTAVWMQENADGSITLSGDGLTKARRDSLLRWISTNL
jgi:ParB/RepB/Spo0J family partition protein